jgi:hypothetical protein
VLVLPFAGTGNLRRGPSAADVINTTASTAVTSEDRTLTKLKEDLIYSVHQRNKLSVTNLNINTALLRVFDAMDTCKNKELTLQEFKEGVNSSVLSMQWSDEQVKALFHVRHRTMMPPSIGVWSPLIGTFGCV